MDNIYSDIKSVIDKNNVKLIFFPSQIRSGSVAIMTMLGNSPSINRTIYHPFLSSGSENASQLILDELQKICVESGGGTVLIKEHAALIDDFNLGCLGEISDKIIIGTRHPLKQLKSTAFVMLEDILTIGEKLVECQGIEYISSADVYRIGLEYLNVLAQENGYENWKEVVGNVRSGELSFSMPLVDGILKKFHSQSKPEIFESLKETRFKHHLFCLTEGYEKQRKLLNSYGDKVVHIDFESLKDSPQGICGSMCSDLGIDYSHIMVDGGNYWKVIAELPEQNDFSPEADRRRIYIGRGAISQGIEPDLSYSDNIILPPSFRLINSSLTISYNKIIENIPRDLQYYINSDFAPDLS